MPIAILVFPTDEEMYRVCAPIRKHLAMPTTQAAARLGVNERRLRKYVTDDLITPLPEKLFHVPLFSVTEVDDLRAQRVKNNY